MDVTLTITHGDKIQYPVIQDGIQWETERKGAPGKLTFKILKTQDALNVQEGDQVAMMYGNQKVFFGFVFSKQRNKDGIITITAYDQLRYFKNKHIYVYENWTTGALLKKICADFQLQWGNVEDTKYPITRTEDNQTLFDIIQNSLDETIMATGEMYVLYDDYGKLALKNINSMTTDLLIDEETAQNFDYKSSIDDNTYNRIVLYDDSGNSYPAWDSKTMNEWGILQFVDKVDDTTTAKTKAKALLKLYNEKTRTLQIKGAFGDTRVRGGSLVVVHLNLGDMILKNYMLVEKVTHNFSEGNYTMDLTVRGGTFV